MSANPGAVVGEEEESSGADNFNNRNKNIPALDEANEIRITNQGERDMFKAMGLFVCFHCQAVAFAGKSLVRAHEAQCPSRRADTIASQSQAQHAAFAAATRAAPTAATASAIRSAVPARCQQHCSTIAAVLANTRVIPTPTPPVAVPVVITPAVSIIRNIRNTVPSTGTSTTQMPSTSSSSTMITQPPLLDDYVDYETFLSIDPIARTLGVVLTVHKHQYTLTHTTTHDSSIVFCRYAPPVATCSGPPYYERQLRPHLNEQRRAFRAEGDVFLRVEGIPVIGWTLAELLLLLQSMIHQQQPYPRQWIRVQMRRYLNNSNINSSQSRTPTQAPVAVAASTPAPISSRCTTTAILKASSRPSVTATSHQLTSTGAGGRKREKKMPKTMSRSNNNNIRSKSTKANATVPMCIDLCSSSDEEDDSENRPSDVAANNTNNTRTTASTGTATNNQTLLLNATSSTSMVRQPKPKPKPSRPLGPPNLFARGHIQEFPNAIDTGFNGSATASVATLPRRGTGTKSLTALISSDLKKSARKQNELPLIWPRTTPVPEASGGFYEELDPEPEPVELLLSSVAAKAKHKKAQKSKKRKGGTVKGYKTQSRVARLAGTLTMAVRVPPPTPTLNTDNKDKDTHFYDQDEVPFLLRDPKQQMAQQDRSISIQYPHWSTYPHNLHEESHFVCADDVYAWTIENQQQQPQHHVYGNMTSPHDLKVLEAIHNLNDKENPFMERCVFVVAERVPCPGPTTTVKAKQQRDNNVDVDVDDDDDDIDIDIVAQLKFHVYFRRALFGLSANLNIKIVLDALEPIVTKGNTSRWSPCRTIHTPVTKRYNKSVRHGHDKDSNHGNGDSISQTNINANRAAHSLPALMWENESEGYDENHCCISSNNKSSKQGTIMTRNKSSLKKHKKYKGAKVTLRDYQKESVAWMCHQENLDREETGGGVAGLNGYFWEKRSFGCDGGDGDGDEDDYYYFPLGGHVLLTPPPVVSGGLLAEEMGLGKTVEVIDVSLVSLASLC
jgi:hypothetical protein